MSDLNIVRISSLHFDEDDDEPSQHHSYNSWRYVDEASLYSIAEDSREEQQSSQATDSRMSSSQQNHNNYPTDSMLENSPIEMQWVTAEELQFEAAAQDNTGGQTQQFQKSCNDTTAIPIPNRDPDEIASQEEENEALGPRHNARRSALFLLLLVCAVMGIILSLTLALRNRGDSQPPTRVSGGVRDSDWQGPQMDPGADSQSDNSAAGTTPTQPAPTTPLVVTTPTTPTLPADFDAYSLVWEALVSCPQTNPDDLVDIDKTQMEVFHTIVNEVKGLILKDANGVRTLHSKVGTDWILEKWGLLMLWFDTTGEYWGDSTSWYTEDDTCLWYNQADNHCGQRRPGGAAVTKLTLDKNKLVGSLPKELCCTPELTELVLTNNGLKGEVPQCFKSQDSPLTSMDLSGNQFVDSIATQSLEVP